MEQLRIAPRYLAVLLLALFACLSGQPALAHAVLVETVPAQGSLLAEPPHEVMLRFNEPVSPIQLSLIGRDGSRALAAVAQDARVTAALPNDLAQGSYLVSYRVVSADSHPVSGAFLFVVGSAVAATLQAPDLHEHEETWSLLVVLNRIVLLASLAFAAGGAIFSAGVLGPGHPLNGDLQRPLRVGALIAIASALLAIPLQGGLLTAAPPMQASTWLHGDIARVGWESHLGRSLALMLCGLTAVAIGAAGRQARWTALSAAGAVIAAGALAASGHAATATPRALATLAMICHAVAITFWAGSLWPLLQALRAPAAEAVIIVRHFSAAALAAVIALIGAGLVLAILQLDGDPLALFMTPYGQLLLLKLALVALLLLLAIHNKRRLTPALARGEASAAGRLAGAIRLEIAAIGLILTVTALLGQTPPPRVNAAAERSGALTHGHGGHAVTQPSSATAQSKGNVARAVLDPARTGPNRLTVTLRGPDGAPLVPLEARAEFSLPQAGVDPLSVSLRAVAPGRYEATTDALIVAGTWQVRLVLLVGDFDQVSFDVALPVR